MVEVRPLTPSIGAEIIGADIRQEADFEIVRQAFTDHSVIAIRDQELTPDDQIEFAERFGPINVNRFFKKHDTHPKVALVLKEADQSKAIGEQWHTDHSYDDEPAMCSILHAIETPPVGGDTVFASMSAAYEALSDKFAEMIDGLNAWHSSRHVFGAAAADSENSKTGRIENPALAKQDALHPVVITHPLSGRKGIYVNPEFTTRIDGWTEAESASVLRFLYEHCAKPDFHCRVSYRPGTVTMWDNRATWHKAINDYAGHRRLMHRITVEGCSLNR
ncbi:MAG: TauD/TfdA family dioxygenase [Rhizobiaceae bacterium]|nr:TauD/TfdA family dioxygenase [Rhizobiaceae bacterium]